MPCKKNKSHFMILNPQEHAVGKWGFPIHTYFPTETCIFLQKHVFSCRNEHCLQRIAAFEGHIARNCRNLQEGFRAQESKALAYFHMRSGRITASFYPGSEGKSFLQWGDIPLEPSPAPRPCMLSSLFLKREVLRSQKERFGFFLGQFQLYNLEIDFGARIAHHLRSSPYICTYLSIYLYIYIYIYIYICML